MTAPPKVKAVLYSRTKSCNQNHKRKLTTINQMKTLLSILIAVVASAQLLHAQTTQTITFAYLGTAGTRQQDITVPAGQVFEVLTWATADTSPATLKVNGIEVYIAPATRPVLSPSFVVAGPLTISLVVNNNSALVCSYRLNTNGQVATQNVASQTVVIPQTAAAPADIILESSTDLITWTAAAAGSYSPATSNRFFRVRLVTH